MLETESTGHYLLRSPFYADVRKTLFDNINNTIENISKLLDRTPKPKIKTEIWRKG